MKQIASFTIDHDRLEQGMYVSRIDGDVITYDIRMKKPNQGDYLSNGALHTFEHLFATYARNSRYAQEVVYVGPMGCRTGFYFLLRDTVSKREALALVQESFRFIAEFEGEIPGSKRWECGNYLEHDLPGAKSVAAEMEKVLEDWNEERMEYAAAYTTIGIIGAMHSELSLLLASVEQHQQEKRDGLTFHTGILDGQRVVLVKAGIGKVNAARCTQLLIDSYHPDGIINTGIAGGLAPELQLGDVVIAEGLLQHDFDVTAFGHTKGYLCTGEDSSVPTIFQADQRISDTLAAVARAVLGEEKIHTGLIATGDQFISSPQRKAELYDTFHALAAEMEGGAIAQVATLSGVPVAVIRAISDLADGTSTGEYDAFEWQAANDSAATVKQTLRLLAEKE